MLERYTFNRSVQKETVNNIAKPILKLLGQNIRALRSSHGWTQETFAEHANINDKEVSHIEQGNRNITIETLVKIANAFEVEPSLLIRDVIN